MTNFVFVDFVNKRNTNTIKEKYLALYDVVYCGKIMR